MIRATCRDVAHVVSETDAAAYPDHVAQHLASCPKCVAFAHQMQLVTEAVIRACEAFEQELPRDFEARLVARLCS